MSSSPSLPRLVRAAAWTVTLLAVAGCTDAAPRRKPVQGASAPAPASAATPATPATPQGAAPATPATPASPVRRGLDPAQATGRSRLTLTLPSTQKLGGFSFTATYDPDKVHVADPTTAPSLQGYLCQPNLAQPGIIRFNCAGLVDEERGGLLATFDIAHVGAAPAAGDFQVTEFEVVDDLARKVEGARAALAIEPVAAR